MEIDMSLIYFICTRVFVIAVFETIILGDRR